MKKTHAHPGYFPYFPRQVALAGLALLLVLAATACNLQRSGSSAPEQQAVLQFLRYIPNLPANRALVSYGAAAAWYTSWNVPRVYNIDDLNELDDTSRAYWLGMMINQTYPPDCLDPTYILRLSMRDDFGFDLFDIDRFIFAGMNQQVVSVLEFSVDRQVIVDALEQKGYTTRKYGDDWVLYSLNEDYQVNTAAKMRTEKLGNLNRIMLSDHFMIVGKATEVVEPALDAFTEQMRSLAEDKTYRASVEALYHSSLQEAGELLGVIWMAGDEFDILPPDQEIEQPAGNLPEFSLATFATRHSQEEGATYLILALVFPKGTDVGEAAQVLEERLEKTASLRMRRPFLEVMQADEVSTSAITAGDLPVTLTVFRLDDPQPAEASEGGRLTARVRSWVEFVLPRDLVFLYTGE